VIPTSIHIFLELLTGEVAHPANPVPVLHSGAEHTIENPSTGIILIDISVYGFT
jgi:hypothetical protein